MLMSRLPGQKFIGRMMVFRRFVLYTVLGNEKDSSQAEGGVGLVISDSSEGGSKGSLVSSSEWTVKDVGSDSIDAIQVFSWLHLFVDFIFRSVYLLENNFFFK
jgi:hypothetical protein